MATSTSAPGKPATRKVAAPKSKQEAPTDKKKKPLQFRFHTVMKPQRIYALTVEVPKSKQSDSTGETMIVLRPVIAGAQVVPAEQRLDTSTAGNQVTFHVTPLACGRLPRARVDVFAPGQAPQEVSLPMSAKTQRLSWLLLVLAIVLPWFMIKVTTGDWRPSGATPDGQTDPAAVLGYRVHSALYANKKSVRERAPEGLVRTEVPLFNQPIGSLPTIAGTVGDTVEIVYGGMDRGVRKDRWAPISCVVLVLMSFVSWMFHRTRKARTRRLLNLGTTEETAPSEPATLQPLSHA